MTDLTNREARIAANQIRLDAQSTRLVAVGDLLEARGFTVRHEMDSAGVHATVLFLDRTDGAGLNFGQDDTDGDAWDWDYLNDDGNGYGICGTLAAGNATDQEVADALLALLLDQSIIDSLIANKNDAEADLGPPCDGCGTRPQYKDIWVSGETIYEPHDCDGVMTCATCGDRGCTAHTEGED